MAVKTKEQAAIVEAFNVVAICEYMKWDESQYRSSRTEFIADLKMLMSLRSAKEQKPEKIPIT